MYLQQQSWNTNKSILLDIGLGDIYINPNII